MNKKHIITSMLLVISIMILTMGGTYAYLLLTSNTTPIENVIDAGEIELDFQTSNTINNPRMFLVKPENITQEAEKLNFTIAHGANSTHDFVYRVGLVDIVISDNFKDADFKWELSVDGTSTKFSGNFSTIGTNTTLLLTTNMLLLELSQTHNLTLKLWLEETSENQNHLLDGNFSAKVKVDALR